MAKGGQNYEQTPLLAKVSEQLFRALIEQSTELMVLIDSGGHIIYINPSVTSIMGYTQEELLGCSALALTHPDDLARARQTFDESRQKPGQSSRITCQFCCRDGTYRCFEATLLNLLAHPDVGAILCTLHDISEREQRERAERKAAEERALQAQEGIRALLDYAPVVLWSVNAQGIYTLSVGKGLEALGLRAGQLVGQKHAVAHANDPEAVTCVQRALAGETFVAEVQVKNVWYETHYAPLIDDNGQISGVVGISTEITARKRAEEELKQSLQDLAASEAKFRHLFEAGLVGAFVSTIDGLFLEANDVLLHLLGYSREELEAGKLHRDILTPPEYAHVSAEAVQMLREQGGTRPYEKVYLHKSGRPIPVLIAVTGLEDPADCCIGFVLDISEQKTQELRKDEFINMASHELKTPVTSLIGYTHLLRSRLKGHPNPQIPRFLDRMDTQLKKLSRLISDLLDISKIQAGQLPYRSEQVSLGNLLQEAVEEAQAISATHQIILQDGADACVIGDRERLRQVLFNLLSNAIRYSPRANLVLVRISKDEKHVLVSVQDFGIGISESDLERVFERFYQAPDPLEQTYPGLGISLYLSRAIIQRHQGRLWVESHKGEGSTFWIRLPLEKRENESVSADERENDGTKTTYNSGN